MPDLVIFQEFPEKLGEKFPEYNFQQLPYLFLGKFSDKFPTEFPVGFLEKIQKIQEV